MTKCRYKVYKREKGSRKREMRAQFVELVDAINYAHADSVGRNNNASITMLVFNSVDQRVVKSYRQGQASE